MHMRYWLCCALASVTLSGCATNQPLFETTAPLFAGPIFLSRAEPAIVSDAQFVPETETTVVHTSEEITWSEPTVLPVNLKTDIITTEENGPYLLDTGDKLRVFVYGQPNLSRIYIVDHAGMITVPLIGNIAARGLTTYGLQDVIRRELGSDYVRDPQVTVDIHENRPFFILGEVRTPGKFPYVSGMTIETAVAIGGGYTERASRRTYRITRRINGFVEKIDVHEDYLLKPGDTVFIYERFL